MHEHEHKAAGAVVLASKPDDTRRSWVEVMPTATNSRNGQWYFTVTRDDLETYAQSIRRQAGRIPVDYDHASAKSDGSTRAAGWFTGAAEVRGSSLWAQVEWTPQAVQEIRQGAYRFLSPEFTFENRDAKTGLLTKAKEILAAALTNRPHFRGMTAVTAAARTTTEGDNMDDPVMQKTAALLAAQGYTIENAPYETLTATMSVAAKEAGYNEPREATVAGGDVHAEAVKILAAQGRELNHTQEQYLAACEQAQRTLAARGAAS